MNEEQIKGAQEYSLDTPTPNGGRCASEGLPGQLGSWTRVTTVMCACACVCASNLSSPPQAADEEFNFLLNGGEIGRDFVLFKHSWSCRSLGIGEQ